MAKKDLITLGAAVLILVIAGGLLLRWNGASNEASEDFPDGFHYKCNETSCGAGFTISHAEMTRQVTKEGGVSCPECGSKNVARAAVCPHCREYLVFTGPRQDTLCPKCGEDMAKLPE